MTLGLEYSDDLVRGVAVDADGRVQAKHEMALASGGVPAAVQQVLSRLRDTAGAQAAVGVAAPDLDDPSIAAVRDALGDQAVVVIGAGEAALVAETWCGAAVDAKTAAVLTLAEHITAGLQIDGRIWRGAFGQAASVGWLALNPVEREDYRRWGGLEAEVGAAGLVRRLVWRVKSGDRSNVVDQVGGDLGRLTAAHVLQGARVGDGVCISVVRDTARYIGMAVANIAVIIDPEVVVLGGTLATSGDMMLESIRLECARRLGPERAGRLRVLLSPFGHDGAAIGAARAAAAVRS